MAAASSINIHAAAAYIREQLGGQEPDVAVVCGSGLASLVNAVTDKITIPYADVPTYPAPSVPGHVGEFVFGRIQDKGVLLLRGRLHAYEGHAGATIAAQIRIFAALGVRALVVTNAAGGVNTGFSVGDFMCITDHLYVPGLAGNHPLMGANDPRFGPRFPSMNSVYNPAFVATLKAAAEGMGCADKLHTGVYAGLSGPSFETVAEIGALRMLGADAVGMSTAPEVVAAAHAGLQVLGMSLITNECMGPEDDPEDAPNHAEVLAAAKEATPTVVALIKATIAAMDLSASPRSPAYDVFKGPPPAAPAAKAAPAAVAKGKSSDMLVVAGVAALVGAIAGAAAGWAAGKRK